MAGLVATMSDHDAPQSLIDLVGALAGDQTFQRFADLAATLGVPAEARDQGT